MKPSSLLALFLACSCALGAAGRVAGQAAGQAAPHAPLVADVHPAPYRASINYTVDIRTGRIDIHNATVLNLLDYSNGRADDDGRDDADIVGGPTWLDLDRFDVSAVSPSTQPEQVRAIVRQALQERFHLTYRAAERPLPAFIITVAKGGAKLNEASDPSAPSGCKNAADDQAGQNTLTCASETVSGLLRTLTSAFKYPLIDRTGLTKRYDFALTTAQAAERVRGDYVQALTDSFAKLGLLITLGDAPQPALVIDAAQQPAPTPPETVKQLAALPDLEFEVASVKRAGEDEKRSTVQPAGSQIIFSSFSMQELLTLAWQLPTGAMLGDAPQWIDHKRFTIRAKLPAGIDAHAAFQDEDEVALMLRKLLVERFGIKFHWGEHELDGWVIAGGTPKMKRADPASRSFCKYGPPRGEKDMRAGGSAFNVEFHCQNVTMAQFADLLQPMARSEVKNRVADKTGIAGSYDFKVFYTSSRKLQLDSQAVAAGNTADLPADQSVGYGIEDAFRTQLGLKLTKQRGMYPALILDHIEEFPTEN